MIFSWCGVYNFCITLCRVEYSHSIQRYRLHHHTWWYKTPHWTTARLPIQEIFAPDKQVWITDKKWYIQQFPYMIVENNSYFVIKIFLMNVLCNWVQKLQKLYTYIERDSILVYHDDVIKWKHFPRNWPFVRIIHRPRWIPHTKASDAELWCFLWSAGCINGWVNNREAGDLRRHRGHYYVSVM